jgi:hypothetical protein
MAARKSAGSTPRGRATAKTGAKSTKPGRRDTRSQATRQFVPAISVLEPIDGLELIERGRDAERTGERPRRE